MLKALEALGYRAQVNGATIVFGDAYNGGSIDAAGTVELRGSATALDVNTIKRAYSTEAVKLAGKKFGWSMTSTAPNKFVAQRRF